MSEIKGAFGFFAGQMTASRSLLRLRQMAKVDHRHFQCRLGRDTLHRLTLLFGKCCAQGSWRRRISLRLCSSAPSFSGPVTRRTIGML